MPGILIFYLLLLAIIILPGALAFAAWKGWLDDRNKRKRR